VSSFVPPEITSEHWIRPRGVEVVGTYALVAESDHRGSDDLEGYAGGLRVLDLSDAEHLVEVARLDLPDPTSDLAVANGWAYVATTAPWVRVVDVSQPQHPVEVTTYEVRDSARSVTATPDHLFVVDGTGTVTMLDVSDPFAPVELASVDTTGDARGVAVADGFAWVPDNRAGLAVLDLAACSTGAPTAVMSWSPEEPIAWEPVQLLDASRGLPTAWSWDLGDGTTSTEQSPVHVFETPGLYRISLIASNRHGIDTTETVIKVGTLVRRPRGRLR
jgi:PKD repeat protein